MALLLQSTSEPESVCFVSAQPSEVDMLEPVLVQTAAARACKTVQRMLDGTVAPGAHSHAHGYANYTGTSDYGHCGRANDPGDVSLSEDDSEDSQDSGESMSAADPLSVGQGASESAATGGGAGGAAATAEGAGGAAATTGGATAAATTGGATAVGTTAGGAFTRVVVEGNMQSICMIAAFLQRMHTHGYNAPVQFDPQQNPVFSDTVLNVSLR